MRTSKKVNAAFVVIFSVFTLIQLFPIPINNHLTVTSALGPSNHLKIFTGQR
ncbi:MAG: hypothetical protein ACFFCS_25225 [Candidatus Hodarchaeota archaeon]